MEFSLEPGTGAPFLSINDPAGLQFDLAGRAAEEGLRWRFLPEGEDVEGLYAAIWTPDLFEAGVHFPTADYATALPSSPGLIAFFDLNEEHLGLLGLADPSGEFTRLIYEPPLELLRFPLKSGAEWRVESRATGIFLGATVSLSDQASVRVRGLGMLDTPAGVLPVLQILTTLERNFESAGFSQIYTEVDFISECGGFVARAISHEGIRDLPEWVARAQVLAPLSCESQAACGLGGRCNAEGYCEADGELPNLAEPLCRPNGDGIISDAEMPIQAGLGGLFRLNDPAHEVRVDLLGQLEGEQPVWDFRDDALGELERVERTTSPEGFWFAPHFPEATYVGVLDAGLGMLAIFKRVEGALQLLGVASERVDGTLLIYDTPVDALRFPLKPGDSWRASTAARGQLEGADVVLEMSYHFTAGAAGRIQLPAGDIPVIPLNMTATQQVEGAPFAMQRRSLLFMAECLGGVTRVVSRNNEEAEQFTQAVEVARLTIPRCLDDLQCRRGALCQQGLCEGEAPLPVEDAGVQDDASVDLDAGLSDAVLEDVALPLDAASPLCNPEGDGVLTRDEFLLAPGSIAHLLVAEGHQPVDLMGSPCEAGRCWDFAAPRENDARRIVELYPVEGAWYAEEFPEASYASLLDSERRWLGLFRLSEGGLDLLGTASEEPRDMLTTYEPPVRLYQFPLSVGDAWVAETTQNGYWGFSSIWTEDRYTIQVLERGQVQTPQGPFDAIQVVTTLEQSVPFTIFATDRVIHTFLSECFGIVARIVGPEDETETFFDRADRVERLMPSQ